MNVYKLDYYDETMDAYLRAGEYRNGTLAVELFADDGEGWEPWATLTVNLGAPEQDETRAFLDTNNCKWAVRFLEDNGLAQPTYLWRPSGYCEYPLYEFTPKFFEGCATRD